MIKRKLYSVLDIIAKSNGYKDKWELLRDYNIAPTVMVPKHKKIDFGLLLLKYLTRD